MKKRIWRKLLIPSLIVAMLACTIQPGLAHFSTQYLSSHRDNFFQQAKSKGGSFSYGGYTYQYGLASALEYNSFDYRVDPDFSTGYIRVCGGACINNPSGAKRLGVLKLKVEFILDDHHHDIFGARHTEQNAAGSEILVWYSKMGTVNLAIVGPGDAELRELLTVVGDIAWEAMTAIANIAFLPFFPSWIAYINTGGAYDQFCGGGYNRDADVHVQGVSGWQYPAWKTSCPSTAEVSYAVEFGYSSLGTTGWKLYKSTIKVSVDFGYVEDTWYGTYRNVKVKSVSFEEYWNVYVYWPST